MNSFFSFYTAVIPGDSSVLVVIEPGECFPINVPCKVVDVERLALLEQNFFYDYIVISPQVFSKKDIISLLGMLQAWCTPSTRIVIQWHSPLWRFVDRYVRRNFNNYFPLKDGIVLCERAGFDVVTSGKRILFPYKIPFLGALLNNFFAFLPIVSKLCAYRWIVARPVTYGKAIKDFSVSIVIPCKNERGTVEDAVKRTPLFGLKQELIFVDGHSIDGTLEEMHRVKEKYKDRDIRIFQQVGRGKWDAVRLGFNESHADILMVLDSDLVIPPEELPYFYRALISGDGEFINGSRLIYRMEPEATPRLNKVVNRAFGHLLSCIIGQRIKDTLCGVKVLWKADYERIQKYRSLFGNKDPFGDFDLIFGAAYLNKSIVDMPVHFKNRVYGSSQIGGYFKNGLRLLASSWQAFKKIKCK